MLECTKTKSVFTLPAGFRPPAAYLLATVGNDVGSFDVGEIKVQADGQILVFETKSPRLDGISFRTN